MWFLKKTVPRLWKEEREDLKMVIMTFLESERDKKINNALERWLFRV